MDYKPLARAEIARILRRHRYSKAEIARRANVGPTSVSHWLKGRSISANVANHAETVARELLAKEEADKAKAGDVNGVSVRKAVEKIRKGEPIDGIQVKRASTEK